MAYGYDALGRRVSKRYSDKDPANDFTQSYTYLMDQDQILLGKAGDGTQTLYLDQQGTGAGIDAHLGEVSQGHAKAYATDHLGSVLNTEVAGQPMEFGAWGETLGTKAGFSKTSAPVAYGFSGRQYDPESDLYYYRARQYSPTMGRFTSPDPMGLNGGDVDFYRYVSNSPLEYRDPQGTGPILYAACIAAVTGGLYLGIYAIEKYVSNQIANQQSIITDAQNWINQHPYCDHSYEQSLINAAQAQISTLNALNLAALAVLPKLVAEGAVGCDAALAAEPF